MLNNDMMYTLLCIQYWYVSGISDRFCNLLVNFGENFKSETTKEYYLQGGPRYFCYRRKLSSPFIEDKAGLKVLKNPGRLLKKTGCFFYQTSHTDQCKVFSTLENLRELGMLKWKQNTTLLRL
jgi:hypothetical protein